MRRSPPRTQHPRGAAVGGPGTLRRRDRGRRLHRPVDGLVADGAAARRPDCHHRAGHLRRRAQRTQRRVRPRLVGPAAVPARALRCATQPSASRSWWTRRSGTIGAWSAHNDVDAWYRHGGYLRVSASAAQDGEWRAAVEACAGLGVADQYVELRRPRSRRAAPRRHAPRRLHAERGHGPSRAAGAGPAPGAGRRGVTILEGARVARLRPGSPVPAGNGTRHAGRRAGGTGPERVGRRLARLRHHAARLGQPYRPDRAGPGAPGGAGLDRRRGHRRRPIHRPLLPDHARRAAGVRRRRGSRRLRRPRRPSLRLRSARRRIVPGPRCVASSRPWPTSASTTPGADPSTSVRIVCR